MSGKGNCYDNAMVETVFKTIKSELIWRTSFQSRRQAEHAIARYIDDFYNQIVLLLLEKFSRHPSAAIGRRFDSS